MAEQKKLWFETLFDLIEKAFRRRLSKLFNQLAIAKTIINLIGNFETVKSNTAENFNIFEAKSYFLYFSR